jgi:hypothetical protein
VPLVSNGPTPPLVNLGEYNPGPLQACKLHQASGSPDTAYIASGQEWIRYSGTWGHPSSTTGRPPRGPVFQGWDHGAGKYTAWYVQGADSPATASTHPWLAGPTVSADAKPDGTVVLIAQTTNGAALANGQLRCLYKIGNGSWLLASGPVAVGAGETLSYMAVDALGNRSAVQTVGRGLQITLTGQPEQNGVFPLDTPLTLTMEAVDTLTHQPVTGLAVYIASSSGIPAGTTGVPFAWRFPSTARYVSEHTGRLGPGGLNVVMCTYYTATHYPSGHVDGGDYGTLWFSTGPNDLPDPQPDCLGFRLSNQTASSLLTYLNTHGGDPTPEFIVEALRVNHIPPTPQLEKAVSAYLAARIKKLSGTIVLPSRGDLPVLAPGRSIVSALD